MATAATATINASPSFRPQSQPRSPPLAALPPPESRSGEEDPVLRIHSNNIFSSASTAPPPATLSSSSSPPSPLSSSVVPTNQTIVKSPTAKDTTTTATCDACHRRKTRCAMKQGINKCYSCDFHRQNCTFTRDTQATQTGKRKLNDVNLDRNGSIKKQARDIQPTSNSEIMVDTKHHTSMQKGSPRTSQHIGMTTELEPLLLDFLPLDHNGESQLAASRIRKFADDGTFMTMVSHSPTTGLEPYNTTSSEKVENLVTPFGPALVENYFRYVHPTFPVLVESDFRRDYRSKRGIPSLLTGAVYLVALKWLEPGPGIQTLRTPDAALLESAVCEHLNEALSRPYLSVIQAGLLISQKSSLFTPRLMAQLVTASFDLGLHQDCSSWNISDSEKGLRKRLAWALYVQDKWCALIYGRPSHIFSSNWTVTELTIDDFENNNTNASKKAVSPSSPSSPSSSASPRNELTQGSGSLFFRRLVALTSILSDILETFYTLKASRDLSAAGDHRTHLILARAKPIQIQLKDWFARLPPELKIDSNCGEDTGANGGLHLAYFAAEITLHRCIIRSITPETADSYLSHICRSAAKTRLISAMDFVNRLRPIHLRSFWPAASRTNFALISAFGILLRTTAQTHEEEEFYRARLREYRWTLSVSRKNAEFLAFAIDNLDGVTGSLRNIPHKPNLEELLANSTPPPARQQPESRNSHHHHHNRHEYLHQQQHYGQQNATGHFRSTTDDSYGEDTYDEQYRTTYARPNRPRSSSIISASESPAAPTSSRSSAGSGAEGSYSRA